VVIINSGAAYLDCLHLPVVNEPDDGLSGIDHESVGDNTVELV